MTGNEQIIKWHNNKIKKNGYNDLSTSNVLYVSLVIDYFS